MNRIGYYSKLIREIENSSEVIITNLSDEEIEDLYYYCIGKFNIDNEWIPYIERNHFVFLSYYYCLMEEEELNNYEFPYSFALQCWRNEIERRKQEQYIIDEDKRQ